MLIAFAGVAITTMGAGFEKASLVGDGLAMLMTLALSAVAVLSRHRTLPPLALSCVAALLAAVAIVPGQPVLVLSNLELLWLAAFGVTTMAVALPCYLLGLRFMPAGRAVLISTMELPLAPLWVWLAYGEHPGAPAALGGAIICAAIVWGIRTKPQ